MSPNTNPLFRFNLGVKFGSSSAFPFLFFPLLTSSFNSCNTFSTAVSLDRMPKTTISSTNPGERGQIKSDRGNVQEGILSKLTAVENVLQELKEEVRNGKNKNGKAEDYPNLTPKLNLNRGFVFGDMNSFSRKEKNQTNH